VDKRGRGLSRTLLQCTSSIQPKTQVGIVKSSESDDPLKMLTGTRGRGHVERYRKKSKRHWSRPRLRNVELIFDNAEWVGNQVDQTELVDWLRRGSIGGACLDVFETEPVPANAFSGLSNVLSTPHNAGVTPWRLRFRDAIANIDAFIEKRPMRGLIR
jgi:D-isomer specific 2-hydroxyacid dehydrogenase-like protein